MLKEKCIPLNTEISKMVKPTENGNSPATKFKGTNYCKLIKNSK